MVSSSSSNIFTLLILGACLLGNASTPGEADTTDAEKSLEEVLASNTTAERLKDIQDELRPMFATLPAGKNGNLGHQVVRYVLHRLFMKRHGWFIRGLEPSSTEPPPYMKKDWVPAYLQGLLELRFGDSGINLRELAALAASLEDLVHQEVVSRLTAVYESSSVATTDTLEPAAVQTMVDSYAMMWIQVRGPRFTDLTPAALQERKAAYQQKYKDIPQAQAWWTKLTQTHIQAASAKTLDFSATASILYDFGRGFSEYNEHECQDLKGVLTSIEDPARPGSGRIKLQDYWDKKKFSYWRFTETADKLRELGLLDDSEKDDSGNPSIIISNYVASRNNCLASSSLYEVCCRNECEELMSHLEVNIAAPHTSASRIVGLVEALSSSTVTAPRKIPNSLTQQLDDVAKSSGGKVQLHGRPFARFMHFAFPRECPYPHEPGSVANPETADEWIGEMDDEEEKEAVAIDVNGNINVGPAGGILGTQGAQSDVLSDIGGSEVAPNFFSWCRIFFVVLLLVVAAGAHTAPGRQLLTYILIETTRKYCGEEVDAVKACDMA